MSVHPICTASRCIESYRQQTTDAYGRDDFRQKWQADLVKIRGSFWGAAIERLRMCRDNVHR